MHRPIKSRRQSGYQWNMGDGIYLVITSLNFDLEF